MIYVNKFGILNVVDEMDYEATDNRDMIDLLNYRGMTD